VARSCGLAVGEDGFGFFRGVAVTAFAGGDAFGEAAADVVAILEKPIAGRILGFDEVERVGKQLGGDRDQAGAGCELQWRVRG
jgi:hypothetical protein